MSILLGYAFSSWALIPAILLSIVIIVRTALEDKTLLAELPGYREFTQKTRYRESGEIEKLAKISSASISIYS